MAAYDPTDPVHLTPAQRLDELTALLARGVRRALAARAGHPAPTSPRPEQIDLESSQIRLDVPGGKSVHGPRG